MSGMQLYFTSLEFLERFTQQERLAVWDAARTDSQVADVMMLGLAAQGMMNDDPRTIASLDILVSKSLLSRERADAILGA